MGKRRGRKLITTPDDIPAHFKALASYPADIQKLLSDADLPWEAAVKLCRTDKHTRTAPVYLDPHEVEKFLQAREDRNVKRCQANTKPQKDILQTLLERIESLHAKVDSLI